MAMWSSKANEKNSGSIVIWVALLFALTFAGALPLIIGNINFNNPPQSAPLIPLVFTGVVFIGYTPTVAALLITARDGGTRALLRQIGTWRVGIAWYVLVLVGPLVLVLFADAIYMILGGVTPKQWLVFPSNFAVIGPLIAGALGEEFGWRGFALPRLQSRYGALWACVIIGTIWATWHLWPIITPGGLSSVTPADVVQTYIRLIATAIVYGWIYNSTNGSLFLVMVAHTGHNIAIDLIQIPTQGAQVVPIIIALLYLIVAIAIILTTHPQTLTHVNRKITEHMQRIAEAASAD
jgi:uncharacterized protein